MAFYKINKFFNPEGRNDVKYYGCDWVQKEDGMYADIPDYAVQDYIDSGRVMGVAVPEVPKLKVADPEKLSAKDVVSGNTVAAAEKKEARVEKAAAEKAPVVKSKSKSKSKGK